MVWLSDEDIALDYVLLPRKASFARVLRFGRESAASRRLEGGAVAGAEAHAAEQDAAAVDAPTAGSEAAT